MKIVFVCTGNASRSVVLKKMIADNEITNVEVASCGTQVPMGLDREGAVQKDHLYSVLGHRYIMYGEWMYAKHSIYYDLLPHYFMEFDVLDRETGKFLDTHSRRELLKGLPISSVPVLAEGEFRSTDERLKYLGDSHYISPDHVSNLHAEAEQLGLDADRVVRETDRSRTMAHGAKSSL